MSIFDLDNYHAGRELVRRPLTKQRARRWIGPLASLLLAAASFRHAITGSTALVSNGSFAGEDEPISRVL